jgi:molybdopterin synthase catalytic subunit
VVFTGTVRAQNDGRAVTALDYEAFAERATAQMAELGERALRDFPELAKVFIEHRTGTLAIGEPAVVVGAAAAHRGQAFDAARWLIDTLKASAAIWKREHWADGGAHWPGADVAVGG